MRVTKCESKWYLSVLSMPEITWSYVFKIYVMQTFRGHYFDITIGIEEIRPDSGKMAGENILKNITCQFQKIAN